MKSIQEYLVAQQDQYTQTTGAPVVNELFGVLFASALIAWVLRDNIKDGMAAWNQHKADKYKHQEEMFKAATERKEKTGGEPSLFQQIAAGGGLLGALTAIKRGAENEKDPVEQKKTMSKLDLLRASAFDENGKERTPEERAQWLKDNVPPQDFEELCNEGTEAWLKTDMKGMSDALEKETGNITQKDLEAEQKEAQSVAAEKGPALEADAKAAKELQDAIEEKKKQKDAAQAELDKAIADATASGDEEAIKKAKLAKAEFNKKMDEEIYQAEKKAIEFDSNRQTGGFLGLMAPLRKLRNKSRMEKLEAEHKKAVEAANKEISDNGGDPAASDPKPEEQTQQAADPEAQKKADEAKKAAEAADAEKKKADDDVAAAEKALKDNTDDTKKEALQKDLDDKKKIAEEAGKKAEAAHKAADDAAKAAQAKPAEPATPAGGEPDPEAKKKAEEAAAASKKADEELAAAEKALKDNTDDSKKAELEAAVAEKKKAAEAAKKAADDAAKAAQAKPAEKPAGGEPDPEAKKKAEEAAAASKKADEDVKAAEDALAKETDPEKKKTLQADLDKKKEAAAAAKKAADDAAKAAQAKPAEPATPAKTEPAKTEPAGGDDKSETVKGVGPDGEPDGSVLTKTVDKDGNEKYTMKTKDGDSVEISKDDFEKGKADAKKAADDLGDDETNGDDEKGGDVDTDDKDTDAEEVDNGQGGKKKVLKNPAQIWHRKKKKSGGVTKSYYNKKGDSISQDEFREKMKKYQEKAKTKPESFRNYLLKPYIMESTAPYTSLRDRLRANIHD